MKKFNILIWTTNSFNLETFSLRMKEEFFTVKHFSLNTTYYLIICDDHMRLISHQMSFKLMSWSEQENLILDLYNKINSKLINHKWRKHKWDFLLKDKSFFISIKSVPFNNIKRRKVT